MQDQQAKNDPTPVRVLKLVYELNGQAVHEEHVSSAATRLPTDLIYGNVLHIAANWHIERDLPNVARCDLVPVVDYGQ